MPRRWKKKYNTDESSKDRIKKGSMYSVNWSWSTRLVRHVGKHAPALPRRNDSFALTTRWQLRPAQLQTYLDAASDTRVLRQHRTHENYENCGAFSISCIAPSIFLPLPPESTYQGSPNIEQTRPIFIRAVWWPHHRQWERRSRSTTVSTRMPSAMYQLRATDLENTVRTTSDSHGP